MKIAMQSRFGFGESGDLFYKGSRKSSLPGPDEDSEFQMDDRRSSLEFDEVYPIASLSDFDGGQKLFAMKDQEAMVQDLKKENFDLKLRLYMTQKNSETAEGRASEYEGQLSALLQRLEEQQRLSEQMEAELKEARMKEKTLITRQKRLELQCAEQTETIHNLSANLSKLSSSSMQNLSTPKHSTPMRNARSMHVGPDDGAVHDSDEDDGDVQPLPNVSTVAPMPRTQTSISSYAGDSASDGLISRDRGVHTSTSSYGKYSTTAPVNKNNYYNTHVTDNRQNRSEGDNVGIVRPNNTRTVVDINYGDASDLPLDATQTKKKKKGLGRLFGLCSGKSGQAPATRESMYRKQEQPHVTVKTYTE